MPPSNGQSGADRHELRRARQSLALLPAEPVPRLNLAYVLAVTVLTVAAGVLRAAFLDQPMRYDEAFTVLLHASSDRPSDWVNYTTPNNHVLHTLLVALVGQNIGVDPPLVRLPAFLAGVTLVPVSAMLARHLSGRLLAGVLAAMMAAAWSLLVEYSANARGYSMVCLATLVLGVLTIGICRDASRGRLWAAWAVVSALGMFTVPVMLYPSAIFALVILLAVRGTGVPSAARAPALKRLVLTLAATALLTALLYAPVAAVSGVGAIVANRFVAPQALASAASALPEVIAQTLADWSRDASWLLLALAGAGLASAVSAGIRRHDALWLVPAMIIVLLPAAALVQRVVPFPRVWLFALPLLLVWSACGLDLLARRVMTAKLLWAGPVLTVALVAAGSADVAWRTSRRPFLISEEPRTLVDAERIAGDIGKLLDGRTALVCPSPGWVSLQYYCRLCGQAAFVGGNDLACRRVLLVVGAGQTLQQVIAENSGLAEAIGRPILWRSYPRAQVYLAPRNFIQVGPGAVWQVP